jgi:hypothetical protein
MLTLFIKFPLALGCVIGVSAAAVPFCKLDIAQQKITIVCNTPLLSLQHNTKL